jgi:hypothetical protein
MSFCSTAITCFRKAIVKSQVNRGTCFYLPSITYTKRSTCPTVLQSSALTLAAPYPAGNPRVRRMLIVSAHLNLKVTAGAVRTPLLADQNK